AQSEMSRKRKAEIEGQAIERYQTALEYYHQAGNLAGQDKTAFQLGDFYLNKANALIASGADPGLIKVSRQNAIKYFQQLINPAKRADQNRVRLLVWLGGLHQQLGDQQTADRYFGDALGVIREHAAWDKTGFESVAEIAE